MLYTIENSNLKVSVETKGAQLKSVFSKDTGVEYLWQGDAKYWTGRAYNLFPFVGRFAEGKYVVEGREYALTARSVMIAKPLEYHYVLIDKGVRYERYIIRFTEESLTEETAEVLFGLLNGDDESRCFGFSGEVSDTIVSIFEHSHIADTLPDGRADSYRSMLLSELIYLFSLARSEQATTYDCELGARVIKYLNEHINRNLSLDFLSKKFFVSKYYLCRVFKKHNGISIHGYMMQKRVMLAKQLIEGGTSAAVAARTVGFRDYSAFYRAFVKIIGKPPISTRT